MRVFTFVSFLAASAAGCAAGTGGAAAVDHDSSTLVDDRDVPKPTSTRAFVVNSTDDAHDANPGDGRCAASCKAKNKCTLRAAIEESNAQAGPNFIELPAGTYQLTIGGLTVSDSVTIAGAGAATTIVDGNGSVLMDHVFHQTGGALHLADLTVRNGGAVSVFQGGGLLLEGENALLERVVVSGNTAFSNGGGIFNREVLQLEQSTVENNVVTSRGGGVYSTAMSTLIVDRSTLDGNQATLGGAIQSFGTLVMRNSTISGNRASAGTGGVINVGFGTLNNVTVTNNMGNGTAGRAGGIANNGTLPLVVSNTIIANNSNGAAGGAPDCAGTISSGGFDLIRDLTDCTVDGDTTGNITGQDPLLGPLADNGGATRTHALESGSPAIDTGNPSAPASSASACEPIDQRGITRPQGPRCDIGSFELEM